MATITQEQFAAALRDSALPVPEGIAAWNAARPLRRFGVYRNNVVSGLIGAVASRFPVAEKIVGEEFFAGMAYEFICLHPPRSPLLLSYGDGFADFVEAFEPAREIAYLADVIRLEAARGIAYHAADAAPLAADRLALARGQLERTAARLHLGVLAVEVERGLAAIALRALHVGLRGQHVGARGAEAPEDATAGVPGRVDGVGRLPEERLPAHAQLELAGELLAGVLLRALAKVANAFEAEREGRSLHAPGHRPERGDL